MNSILRKLARSATSSIFRYLSKKHWRLLRYYPHVIPDDEILERWQTSEWPDYQNWITKNSLLTNAQWKKQQIEAIKYKGQVKVSIVTPVYNTKPNILRECILSVRTQTSPFWELILSDDGSTDKSTLDVLNSRLCKDPRIQIIFPRMHSESGISAATNRGIDASTGNYLAFLDHDDRIAPEAIYNMIVSIEENPELEIIYSDRDMLSIEDKRFMHLMKPDWSPENLYAGNYIFHLMCYSRDLIFRVGKLRSKFDGSQDYDLILRCMETSNNIKHIPKILYHWRQHGESVSLESGSKSYAFDAGIAALQDALRRRNTQGKVTENKTLWRGNYEVELPLPSIDHIGLISLPADLPVAHYAETIMASPVIKDLPPYIFIHNDALIAEHENTTRILASWLEIKGVGMTSGCTLSAEQKILYAGMIYDEKGNVATPYLGAEVSEPGYMAVTKAVRNVGAPNPFSVMIKRDVWLQSHGLDPSFETAYSIFDFALTSLHNKWRIVYVPRAIYNSNYASLPNLNAIREKNKFYEKWKAWLDKGDPYFSPNLLTNSDYTIFN